MIEVVRNATMKTSNWNLPVSREQVIKAIDERERAVSTYLGKGLAMPHARLAGLQLPIVMFIRSENGIPYRNHQEKAYLVFVLLTPAGQPRVHQRLQSVIATIPMKAIRNRPLTLLRIVSFRSCRDPPNGRTSKPD